MFLGKYKITCVPEPEFMSKKEFAKYLFKTRRNRLISMYESVPVNLNISMYQTVEMKKLLQRM